MRRHHAPSGGLVPLLTAALAAATLAAPFWPPLFPIVLAAGSGAACALALHRRPSRALRFAVAGVIAWLAAGLGGAWALGGRPVAGLLWVLVVLFGLPLPLLPWLYARTFANGPALHPGRAPDATREGGDG
jgi:hypothetical protein